ncbi:iron-containing alcohol dehydrogenase [Glaciecola sp. MH2013]|uniref:iron-containing alcohol dehydrogenase n=1 Tax=Glaciecola sp. MH2013 TaxID=2785524 RepID=UPI00189E72D1|nr:iron-containing alcohol dehydrogenase [Glaciecola sp. MH2013]MBF7073685.1 iron-containing alcohol dehydrogenase [Glaciecola sp. MH2013]
MYNFQFSNPTKIVFGKGQIQNIGQEIDSSHRVLLMYGGGSIKKNGVYQQVIESLSNHDLVEFSGVEPNPSLETLSKAIELVESKGIDYILAVGGGSVIDGAKFVAAAAKFEGDDPWDILAKGAKVVSALPLSCILTLPATGTESNGNSVITKRSTQDKLPFSSPHVYPQVAILDPSVTFSLPPRQVANGVVDAFVHTIEQYLTYDVNAPVQDRFAEGLLSTLIEEGPKALSEPDNYDVRANIMWAATMALNGLIGVGVPQDWATHGIGHEITALHGLDHAQTLAIVLPSLMREKKEHKAAKLLQFGRRVWGITEGSDDAIIEQAIAKTAAFFEEMGVPTTLSGYGIEASAIDALVAQMEKHKLHAMGEHKDINPDVARRILENAA